jgi:hypothetical protein
MWVPNRGMSLVFLTDAQYFWHEIQQMMIHSSKMLHFVFFLCVVELAVVPG